MTESSCVYYHNPNSPSYSADLIDIQKGGPASVEFNFETVWEYYKTRNLFSNFINSPTYLNFVHVHPTGSGIGVNMSATDVNCLEGLTMAFGESPMFHIIQFHHDPLTRLEGKHQCYVREKNGKIVPIYEGSNTIQQFLKLQQGRDKYIIQVLKLLAYQDI